MKIAPTRSGRATIVPLTDEQTALLSVGEELLVETVRGLRVLLVSCVRSGVAYDDSQPPQAYGVPVVEGVIGAAVPGRALTYAAADLLAVQLDEPQP